MHSRCDDKAINLYVSRMVKQATQRDCNVTVHAGAPEDEDLHDHRQGSDWLSSLQAAVHERGNRDYIHTMARPEESGL